MLVDTMKLKSFTFVSPKLLYIFLSNLYSYIFSDCEYHNIFFHCGDNIGVLCSIYGIEDIYTLFISPELDDTYIGVNIESTILVWSIVGSVFIDQTGKWEHICYGLIIIPHFTIIWDHHPYFG